MSNITHPVPTCEDVMNEINACICELVDLRGAVKRCDPQADRADALGQLQLVYTAHHNALRSMGRICNYVNQILPNWMWDCP